MLLPSQSCAVFEWVLCSPPIETPLSCSSTAGATDRKTIRHVAENIVLHLIFLFTHNFF